MTVDFLKNDDQLAKQQSSGGKLEFVDPLQQGLQYREQQGIGTPDSIVNRVTGWESLSTAAADAANTTISSAIRLGYETFAADPNYNPFKDVTLSSEGDEFVNRYKSSFANSPNPAYTAGLIKDIHEKQIINDIINQNPNIGMVGAFVGGLFDLSTAVGAFGIPRTGGLLQRTAIRTAEGAAMAGLQAPSLMKMNPGLSGEDTLDLVLFSAVLGGGLGALGESAGLFKNTMSHVIEGTPERIDNTGAILSDDFQGGSVGAALNEVDILHHSQEQSAQTSSIYSAMEKVAAKFMPGKFLKTSESGYVNALGTIIGGDTGIDAKNLVGRASFSNLPLEINASANNKSIPVLNTVNDLFADYKNAGGKLSTTEFPDVAKNISGGVFPENFNMSDPSSKFLVDASKPFRKFFDDAAKDIDANEMLYKKAEGENYNLAQDYIPHDVDRNIVGNNISEFTYMVERSLERQGLLEGELDVTGTVHKVVNTLLQGDNNYGNFTYKFKDKNLKAREFKFSNQEIAPYLKKDTVGMIKKYSKDLETQKGLIRTFGKGDYKANAFSRIDSDYETLIGKSKEQMVTKNFNEGINAILNGEVDNSFAKALENVGYTKDRILEINSAMESKAPNPNDVKYKNNPELYVQESKARAELVSTYNNDILKFTNEDSPLLNKEIYDQKLKDLFQRQKKDKDAVNNLLDIITDNYGKASPAVSTFATVMRSIQSLRLMGMNVFAQLPDMARIIGTNAMQKFGQSTNQFLVDLNGTVLKLSKEEKQMMGIISEDMATNGHLDRTSDIYMSDYNSGNKVMKALGEAVSIFQKITLVEPLNRFTRTLVGNTAINNMMRSSYRLMEGKVESGTLEAIELARVGIDKTNAPELIKLFQQHKTVKDGVTMINFDKWNTIEGIRFAANIRRFIDRTIVEAGAGDKPFWISTEIGRTVGQFKGFMFGSMNKSVLGGVQELGVGGEYVPVILQKSLAGTLLGAVTYITTNAIQGKDPDLSPKRLMLEGFNRGGVFAGFDYANNVADKWGLGIGGALGLNGTSRYYQTGALEPFLGPTFDHLNNSLPKALQAATSGNMTGKDMHTIVKAMPFQNYFLTGWATNKLKDN